MEHVEPLWWRFAELHTFRLASQFLALWLWTNCSASLRFSFVPSKMGRLALSSYVCDKDWKYCCVERTRFCACKCSVLRGRVIFVAAALCVVENVRSVQDCNPTPLQRASFHTGQLNMRVGLKMHLWVWFRWANIGLWDVGHSVWKSVGRFFNWTQETVIGRVQK